MFKFQRIVINKEREKASGAGIMELTSELDKKELSKSISAGFKGAKALSNRVLGEIVELSIKYNNLLFDADKKAKDVEIRVHQAFLTALRIFEVVYSSNGNFWIIQDENGTIMGFFYVYDLISLTFPKKEKDGVKYVKKPWSATLAGCLKKEYWGLNTKKIFKSILNMLFEEENFKKIKCEIFSSNPYVKGLLKHFKFENEGILKAETMNRGEPENVEIWALRGENWEKIKKKFF